VPILPFLVVTGAGGWPSLRPYHRSARGVYQPAVLPERFQRAATSLDCRT